MEKNAPNADRRSYLIGLLLIILSLSIYLLGYLKTDARDFFLFSGTFIVNYLMSIGYLIYLGIEKWNKATPRPKITYQNWLNVTVLFTVSAFSLNKEMRVFAPFPLWLDIYTISTMLSILSYPYLSNLPSILKKTVYVLTGASLVLSIYMTIYLFPIIGISMLTFWFFGISLHGFVTICWLWATIKVLLKKEQSPRLKYWACLGAFVPLLLLGIYLNKWYGIQNEIKDILAEKHLQLNQELPDAIVLAQQLPSDPLTEQIIISPYKSQQFFGDGFSINSSGEKKFHDPLSCIAIALFGDVYIDRSTVETILNIRKDYRHKTSRRLWTGINLSTSAVSSNIQLFPHYRLAYQEKTFTIHNDQYANRNSQFTANTQEAVYTFHIPEGSIVTSLSLWINGKEEKSRLSTQKKADSAYTNIVGIERRDPALVHWQEGNRIRVTVFPCTEQEDRVFKIGFTTPLSVRNGKIWLDNIFFEGPGFDKAREATHISFVGEALPIKEGGEHFKRNAKGDYHYTGDYIPDWKVGFELTALSTEKFCFNGQQYMLKEVNNEYSNQRIEKIYLDVTKEWKKEEYDRIIEGLKGKQLYMWSSEKIKVTTENKDLSWAATKDKQFSLPFLHDISDPEKTVVITKPGDRSPLLEDLKNSTYADNTTAYLKRANNKIRVINIGEESSPFWRSLHELRLINYSKLNVTQALEEIKKETFTEPFEDSLTVSLSDSRMSIVKSAQPDSTIKGNAPDHLLRLFAYNDILRNIGKVYFEKEQYEEALFRKAEEAYVVTPVTSMIVLESEADYQRMGIDKNKNTIGNAGVLAGGAVPEPHEWLLIGVVVFLIMKHLHAIYRQNRISFSRK